MADSVVVVQINSEGDKFYNQKEYEKALEKYQEALRIAEKAGYRKGMMLSNSNLASTYRLMGNFQQSIFHHQKTIAYASTAKDETQLAKSFINLGNVYRNTAEYKEALDSYLKGLDYSEKTKNTRFQSICLNNIGEIYRLLEQNEQALQYYDKSLLLGKNLKDENQIATALTNIASVQSKLEKYESALANIQEAEKLSEKLNNQRLLQINFINKGNIYAAKKQNWLAIQYYEKALSISKELKDNYNQALVLGNLGRLNASMQDFSQAQKRLYEGLYLAQQLNFKQLIAERYYDLMLFYSRTQFSADSISFYAEKHRQMKELINNEKSAEEIARLQNAYDFRQKQQENELLKKENKLKILEVAEIQLINEKNLKDKEILSNKNELLETQNQLQKLELEKQKLVENEIRLRVEQEKRAKELLQKESMIQEQTIKNQRKLAIVLGLIAVLVASLAVVLTFAYRQRQRANRALQFKNQEINQQKEEILAQRDLLHQQNELLAFERKNTLDSIRYAKNIQNALLPFDKHFQNFFVDFFLFYQPKDIVSGDFYHFFEKDGKGFLAVADCTGHGVPGAFMSSLGIASLENIIIGKNITDPEQILFTLDKTIREALHQEETGNQDGMDVALCVIDKEKQCIEFAGANNGMVAVIDGQFLELPPNKNGIGGFNLLKEKKFDKIKIHFQQSCQLYLYSDGFQDQFGGEKDKKFSKKRLKELLQNISQLSAAQRLPHIQAIFQDWKGSNEQIDDITLIGVTIYANT